MGNSSLANAIKRKTHKERSQPAARSKYGLLEKHKDYVLRARDFHRKEKAIKKLQAKAEARNPDEFYFAMEHARTKGGVHVTGSSKKGGSGGHGGGGGGGATNRRYSQDELLLMKTQDAKYLATKAASEAAKAERLSSGLHFIGAGAPSSRRHTVFVDAAADAASFRPEAFFDTPRELLGRTFNRPRRAQLEGGGGTPGTSTSSAPHQHPLPGASKKIEKRKHTAYKELMQRRERAEKLAALAARMSYEKQVMGSKGGKSKVRGKALAAAAAEAARSDDGAAALPVYRWRRQRAK